VGAALYARNHMNRGVIDDEFERFGSERTKIRHEVRLWGTHPQKHPRCTIYNHYEFFSARIYFPLKMISVSYVTLHLARADSEPGHRWTQTQ